MRWILACCFLLSAAVHADDRATVIVVVGAEGAAEYAPVFAKSADGWADAARRTPANLVEIGRDNSPAVTDRDRLQQTLQSQLKETVQPLWLVFIGHGTYDGKEAKFNLRGPDVSDEELKTWLTGCKRPLAIIDCSSSSAPFLSKLSAPGRVIITATRSGHEVNFARFGQYLAAAIADPAADLDKDGQTSLLEAFLAASRRTEEFYKQQGRLATEHALLDDNGDGQGIAADWFQGIRTVRVSKDGKPLDGARAHQWHLVPSADERSLSSQQRAGRDELELKIEALRAKKATIAEAEYYRQLEELLLALARVYQAK